MIGSGLFKCLLFIINVVSISSLQYPQGKFCGKIFNNEFDIYFNNTNSLADISAIIFNTSYKCDNEDYKYNNITDLITMPSDPNDCLNVVLEKYNLCPCPPELKYNKEENIVYIMNTEIGNIELNSCV